MWFPWSIEHCGIFFFSFFLFSLCVCVSLLLSFRHLPPPYRPHHHYPQFSDVSIVYFYCSIVCSSPKQNWQIPHLRIQSWHRQAPLHARVLLHSVRPMRQTQLLLQTDLPILRWWVHRSVRPGCVVEIPTGRLGVAIISISYTYNCVDWTVIVI